MDLQHWQAQFENWLKNHHQHQDAAHDVCHFRRVWATAQKLAADDDVDMLVILTACYFHDIVSLAKNHPQRQRSSAAARLSSSISPSCFAKVRLAQMRRSSCGSFAYLFIFLPH